MERRGFLSRSHKAFQTVLQRFIDRLLNSLLTESQAGVAIGSWDNDEKASAGPPGDDDEDDELSDIMKYWVKTRISPVYSLALESQALWCLSGMKSGNISLWSVRHDQGSLIHLLEGAHSEPVSVLSLVDSEKAALSGSWDKRLKKWDLNTGAAVREFIGHTSQITSLDVHPTDPNLFLSSGFDGTVLIWDSRLEQPFRMLDPTPNNIPPFCLSAKWGVRGNKIYCGRREESVDEWYSDSAALTGARLQLPHNSGPVSAVMPVAENRILCASSDNLRLWNASPNPADDLAVPFKIIPGHHGGMISDMLLRKDFLVTTSGDQGLQGFEETNQMLIFESKV
eukprot:Partr_v1_DN25329_c0_g1_i5_m21972 putative Transcription factor SPT8